MYELYKKAKSEKEYFKDWDSEQFKQLTEDLKEEIYKRYLVKCEVFQRDNFTCQNSECKSGNNITFHHLKFKKNGGQDKARNGVTLCHSCHQGFHKCRRQIAYFNTKSLPVHIRGHTFKLKKEVKVNWKIIRNEMKVMRKSLKSKHGINISWKQLALLMKFLRMPYNDRDD